MRQRRDQAAWKLASKVAEEALQGDVAEHVGHATHYHTDKVDPYWASSLRRLTSMGDHIFYVWRGAAGQPEAFSRAFRTTVHQARDGAWRDRLATPATPPAEARNRAVLHGGRPSSASRPLRTGSRPFGQYSAESGEAAEWIRNQNHKKLPMPNVEDFPEYEPTG
jgi:hypothetical protein